MNLVADEASSATEMLEATIMDNAALKTEMKKTSDIVARQEKRQDEFVENLGLQTEYLNKVSEDILKIPEIVKAIQNINDARAKTLALTQSQPSSATMVSGQRLLLTTQQQEKIILEQNRSEEMRFACMVEIHPPRGDPVNSSPAARAKELFRHLGVDSMMNSCDSVSTTKNRSALICHMKNQIAARILYETIISQKNSLKAQNKDLESMIIRRCFPPRFNSLISQLNIHCKSLKQEGKISSWTYFVRSKDLYAKARFPRGGFTILSREDVKQIVVTPAAERVAPETEV